MKSVMFFFLFVCRPGESGDASGAVAEDKG
jgi:hypothetical protein